MEANLAQDVLGLGRLLRTFQLARERCLGLCSDFYSCFIPLVDPQLQGYELFYEQTSVLSLHSVRVVSHGHGRVCLAPGLVGAREEIILASVQKFVQDCLLLHLLLRTSSKPFIAFLTA